MSVALDPLPIAVSSGSAGATLVFRSAGKLLAGAVLKASFAMTGAGLRPIAPEPVARQESNVRGAGVPTPDEVAPFLARADVYIHGRAEAAASSRLAVHRGREILVDRRVQSSGPGLTTAYGPLSKTWPVRSNLLRGQPAPTIVGGVLTLPDGLDWHYFNAAPTEQQCDFFSGSEVVVLEGLHRQQTRIELLLPAFRAGASLIEGGAAGRPIPLSADTLAIDLERGVVHVLLRGSATLTVRPTDARIEAGVRFESRSSSAVAPAATPPPSVPPPSSKHDATASIDPSELAALREKYVTPFRQRAPAPTPLPPIPPPAAAVPALDPGRTSAVDASVIAALRAQYVTPFAPASERKPPPPPPPPKEPAVPSGTAQIDESVVRELRAAYGATPFGARPPPPTPPPPVPAAPPPSPVAAPPAAPLPARPPVAVVAPPVAPLVASPIARVPVVPAAPIPIAPAPIAAPRPSTPSKSLDATGRVDEEELASLRRAFATPFENPFKRAEAKPPSSKERSPEPSPRSLGDTGRVDPDEIRELRAKFAAPFQAPAPAASRPAAPVRSGSLGACFLAALAELPANASWPASA